MISNFTCIRCGKKYEIGSIFNCECGGLLQVIHDNINFNKEFFDSGKFSSNYPYQSGVWRFKELIYPSLMVDNIITKSEGNTNIYNHKKINDYTDLIKISLKHEGENPTGSFKDRGMTVAISEAVRLNAKAVACASTGNTSASMAAYAAQAGLRAFVFIPEGEIAYGKLSQALAYGAKVIQIKGNFDDAMKLVQEASSKFGLYLVNSINPWRIEGQKTIIFELLQQRNWKVPDWIIVPAGNLGNTSAFGKALLELKKLNFISKLPHLASIQAENSSPFYNLYKNKEFKPIINPKTIASAIKIGSPVSWEKAINVIKETNGVVEKVSDDHIMDAKAEVDQCGIGCEPASAASVAGAQILRQKGIIDKKDDIVCILTGNILKDPDNTINYHMGLLKNIKPRLQNIPIIIDPKAIDIQHELKKIITLKG
ncbi:threonine synthase [Candidatus Bathyarchaeota archaeon]|nr:threonine synthase [Candidatus Bathyarchaeota archaeon]